VAWKIALAGLVMGAVLYPLRSSSIFLSAPAGALVYAGALYALRAIEPEEWRLALGGLRRRNPPAGAAVGEGGKA
jgi:hypothetical protein